EQGAVAGLDHHLADRGLVQQVADLLDQLAAADLEGLAADPLAGLQVDQGLDHVAAGGVQRLLGLRIGNAHPLTDQVDLLQFRHCHPPWLTSVAAIHCGLPPGTALRTRPAPAARPGTPATAGSVPGDKPDNPASAPTAPPPRRG